MSEEITPHRLERMVIKRCMSDRDDAMQITAKLNPDAFLDTQHRAVYRTIKIIVSTGQTPDLLRIKDKLENSGLKRASNIAEEIYATKDGIGSIDSYIKAIKSNAVRDVARRRAKMLLSKTEDLTADEIRNLYKNTTLELNKIFTLSEAHHASDVRDELGMDLYRKLTSSSNPTPLIIGLPTIDTGLRGQDHRFSILMGASSSGKSLHCANASVAAARRGIAMKEQGKLDRPLVMNFVLESGRNLWFERVISCMGNIPEKYFQYGKFEDLSNSKYEQDFEQALSDFSSLPLTINDDVFDVDEICRTIMDKHISGYDIILIVIDHIQLVRGGGTNEKVVNIENISGQFKSIADQIGCPILCASQATHKGKPGTAKPKWSRAIFEDASAVFFKYAPHLDPESKTRKEGHYMLNIKNRLGPNLPPIEVLLSDNGSTRLIEGGEAKGMNF